MLKLAFAQMCSENGEPGRNVQKMCSLIEQASAQGAELLVFPEMADTGYHPSVFDSSAQSWPGPVLDALRAAAAKNSLAVFCGMSEKTEEGIYNSMAAIDASGELVAKYRKIHLFTPAPADEARYFLAGDSVEVAEVAGVRVGLSICYDLRFPELYRAQALDGAQLLINSAAWPAKRSTHWDYLTRARAIENQAYFLGVASVGPEGAFVLNGNSRLVSPQGEVVAEAKGGSEQLIVAELDIAVLNSFRAGIPTFSSRREDVYGSLKTSKDD